MKNIGFLGCGKIGKAMLDDLLEEREHGISFICDPYFKSENSNLQITDSLNDEILEGTDLVVEAAMASVLKENIDVILKHSNLMVFSVTAFADEEFYKHALELAKKYKKTIYLPHGAVIAIDGISAGRRILNKVTIETIKSPKSLGLTSDKYEVVYEGSTRGACEAFPRNVNVHATVALAGLGFDKTYSKIIADPEVTTNTHLIYVEGKGINFKIDVSSLATGGVTGKYTPYSAVASMHKIIDEYAQIKYI